ncbi:MAG: PQQ-binding-like beta-propeller repeat protein, partial [Pirellulaceae bacterium]
SDPLVAALDPQDGSIAWKTPRDVEASKTFSFATATELEFEGVPQVVVPGSNVVMALDPRTGAELWRLRYDGYSVIPKPVYGHGLVYVCTGYNRPQLLAIRLGGRGDVTDSHLAWKVDRNVPHTPSLLLDGENLFMVSDGGIASCLDAVTGKVVWQERLGGNYSSSPVLNNGLLYFQSEDGTTSVVRASREFARIATNAIGERTLASFAVSGATLFLRSDVHLYRIEER